MELKLNLGEAISATKQQPSTQPQQPAQDNPLSYHIQRLESMLEKEGVPLEEFKEALSSLSSIIQERPELHTLLKNHDIGTIAKAIIKAKDIELTPVKKKAAKKPKGATPSLAPSMDLSSLGDLKL